MTRIKRALLAVALIGVGWTLMALGYDKPEWYFQASGIAGFVLVTGATIWWPISARRARPSEQAASGSGMPGA
jgi:presenilin-like A22 family membrane protease